MKVKHLGENGLLQGEPLQKKVRCAVHVKVQEVDNMRLDLGLDYMD